MSWYAKDEMTKPIETQACTFCGGRAPLMDTLYAFPICDHDCLEQEWKRRVEQTLDRYTFVAKTNRESEKRILEETRYTEKLSQEEDA